MDDVFGRRVDRRIGSTDDLREIVPPASHWVKDKVIDHIDDLSRRFIGASPLAIISTVRSDGLLDLTPRGDPPGFVRVLDRGLLAIPDRPGNRRMDTFENLFRNPAIGIIFVIPGHGDTLRVSGEAAVVQASDLGRDMAVKGRVPEFVLLVRVKRVLSHCPKAFIRGRVWEPDAWPDTAGVPTLAELMQAHGAMSESLTEIEVGVREDRETRLY